MRQWIAALYNDNRALSLNPNYAKAATNRPRVLAQLSPSDKAFLDYNAALEMNPGNASPFFHLGKDQPQQDHDDQALSAYAQALEATPGLSLSLNSGPSGSIVWPELWST